MNVETAKKLSLSVMVMNGSVRFDGNCSETRAFCGAVCCKNTIVLLTDDEAKSGKYDMASPTENCNCAACQAMRSSGKKALRKSKDGCIYLSGENKCSIYDDRPSVCKGYDCPSVWWGLTR